MPTLGELYSNYDVVGMHLPSEPSARGHAHTTVTFERPRVGMIADLVVAVLSADEDTYDQYRTFKLFESFPEVGVALGVWY